MSINTDPTLVNQERQNQLRVNNNSEVDDEATVDSSLPTVTDTTSTSVETDTTVADVDVTNEVGTESVDVETTSDITDEVTDVDEVEVATSVASEGYDADVDGVLVFGLTNAIKGGADLKDTFKTELMSMAEEKFGTSEMINEILDNDGNKIQVYKGESGEEFRIIEHAHNEKYDLNKTSLVFEDNSAVELQMLDNGISGVGIHRISGENEDGSKDYTYVNSHVIQEGNVRKDQDDEGNDIFIQDYDQVNRADGSITEDVTTTFHNNGMVTTQFDDDEGVGHLLVSNGNQSASRHYTSEDNYSESINNSYAQLGEDGFVSDWDDGTNIDTSDALYKNFDEEVDPFLEEIFAELRDPEAVGEVDGVDAGDELENEESDGEDNGELSSEASSVDDLTLDLDGDGIVSDEEREANRNIGNESNTDTRADTVPDADATNDLGTEENLVNREQTTTTDE